jgi:hypothetical protein
MFRRSISIAIATAVSPTLALALAITIAISITLTIAISITVAIAIAISTIIARALALVITIPIAIAIAIAIAITLDTTLAIAFPIAVAITIAASAGHADGRRLRALLLLLWQPRSLRHRRPDDNRRHDADLCLPARRRRPAVLVRRGPGWQLVRSAHPLWHHVHWQRSRPLLHGCGELRPMDDDRVHI